MFIPDAAIIVALFNHYVAVQGGATQEHNQKVSPFKLAFAVAVADRSITAITAQLQPAEAQMQFCDIRRRSHDDVPSRSRTHT